MEAEKRALERALAHALDYLDGLDERAVAVTATPADLHARIDDMLPEHGAAAEDVIDALVAATAGGQLGSASGRFFAWAIGGALPAALAADWLASTWDVNACLYACGPAAAVVEETAGAWVKTLLDLPDDASFAFTTGCQMAHVTCLAAARHALLARRGWDVEKQGLTNAPRLRVLASAERHGSIERALRLLGIGTDALVELPIDDDGRVTAATLATGLANSGEATIVVPDAADLNIAAFDPFDELVPLAKEAGAWVHIDGAFGLWARASTIHRHLAEGVDLADSWATDAHKWLNTPQDCGVAVVRDHQAHRAAMTMEAAYLTAGGGERDAFDWTPEWSRRARGYSVYAAIRELGRTGIENLVDRCCAHAQALVRGIGSLDGASVVASPTLNQGLVRFLDPVSSDEAAHDLFTDAMIAAINAEGTAFFSGTRWRGRRAMRISVLNWRTDQRDVDRTIDAVSRVLAQTVETRRNGADAALASAAL